MARLKAWSQVARISGLCPINAGPHIADHGFVPDNLRDRDRAGFKQLVLSLDPVFPVFADISNVMRHVRWVLPRHENTANTSDENVSVVYDDPVNGGRVTDAGPSRAGPRTGGRASSQRGLLRRWAP